MFQYKKLPSQIETASVPDRKLQFTSVLHTSIHLFTDRSENITGYKQDAKESVSGEGVGGKDVEETNKDGKRG